MSLPESFLAWSPSPNHSDKSSSALKSNLHKSGLWNGIIYLSLTPVARHQLSTALEPAITFLEEQGLIIEKILSEDWHISLSRHFQIAYRYIQPFFETFCTKLELENLTQRVASTTLDLSRIVVLESTEPSSLGTTFFAFSVFDDRLFQLLRAANSTMSEFSLTTYFDPPLFHVSFASTKQPLPNDIKLTMIKKHPIISLNLLQDVNVKIGNKKLTQALH